MCQAVACSLSFPADGPAEAKAEVFHHPAHYDRWCLINRRQGRSGRPWSFFLSVAVLLLASLHQSPLVLAASCAAEGEKSKECGGIGGNKPDICCNGLTCWDDRRNTRCIPRSKKQNASTEPRDDGPGQKSKGNTEKCAAYGEWAVSCGEENLERPHSCCEGYKCERGSIKCTNASKETAPLDEIDPKFQWKRIVVNDDIVVKGTTFETAHDSEEVKINVPRNTEKGDMLLMLIGGSASGKKRPREPSGKGWKNFLEHGKNDLNIMALYKWYDDDDDSYRIGGGKNTLAIVSAIEGVDRKDPIVDALAVRNSKEGKDGRAEAPPVFGIRDGAKIGVFVFDDPQVVQVINDDNFHVLVTSKSAQGGDGMAAFVAPTDKTGYTDPISVAGSVQKGGGNDMALTITLRADGSP